MRAIFVGQHSSKQRQKEAKIDKTFCDEQKPAANKATTKLRAANSRSRKARASQSSIRVVLCFCGCLCNALFVISATNSRNLAQRLPAEQRSAPSQASKCGRRTVRVGFEFFSRALFCRRKVALTSKQRVLRSKYVNQSTNASRVRIWFGFGFDFSFSLVLFCCALFRVSCLLFGERNSFESRKTVCFVRGNKARCSRAERDFSHRSLPTAQNCYATKQAKRRKLDANCIAFGKACRPKLGA